MSGDDKRIQQRYDVKRLAFVKSATGTMAAGGTLGNVSSSGVLVMLAQPVEDIANTLPNGQLVDVVIDEFPPLSGKVVRTSDESIAVHFTIDSPTQEELLENILDAVGEGDGDSSDA